MHELLVVRSIDIVREIDEQLGEAALRRGVVTEDRGESGIAKRLRKALAQSFAGARVVTQALNVSNVWMYNIKLTITGGSIGRHA